MAQDYSTYLATNVLNEQQHVSYRNLSRALKVHSNLAKQMLYEFHRKQNSKKPGTVHATYIITGTKRSAQSNGVHSQENGDDTIMRSSPPLPGSSMPQEDDAASEVTPTRSIMLVKEEHLEKAKELYESISGMHIYSLQAGGLSDVQVLTECNRKVQASYASEDPLKEWGQYGVIQNPNVKRRTRKNGPPPAAAPKPEPAKAKAAVAATKSSAAEVKEAVKPTLKTETSNDAKGAHSKPVGSSKAQSSSIFKSFAKGAAKPKPKKTDSQDSAAAASPAALPSPAAPAEDGTEDVPMTGFSDDDMDDDTGTNLLGEDPEESKAPTGPSRKQRKAQLEALMDEEDEEDEPMNDADSPAAAAEESQEQHDEGALDEAASKEEPKESVTVENGRRRGRRRVMKKKTVKDEEGYLVTREEAAWESFSEEEPAPKRPKVSVPAKPAPAAKKGAKAGGGGNIMSFFKKK